MVTLTLLLEAGCIVMGEAPQRDADKLSVDQETVIPLHFFPLIPSSSPVDVVLIKPKT